MSYLYEQEPEEQARALDYAQTHPITQESFQPSFFSGAPTAAGEGALSGLVKLGGLAEKLSFPQQALGYLQKRLTGHSYLEESRALRVKTLKALTPDPLTTGMAGQVLHGVLDVAPTAVAGFMAGGPVAAGALVGGSQGVADYEVSRSEGIDPTTALEKAGVTGITSAAGAMLPGAIGLKLLPNIGFSVAANVGLGMAQRGATAAVLDANGYHAQAAQYKWLDGEAIAVDAILGAAFGVLGHLHAGKEGVPEPLVDAAMKTQEKLHTEFDAQPGVHTTPESREAGVEAFSKAMSDMVLHERMPDATEHVSKMDVLESPATREFYTEMHSEAEKAFGPTQAEKISEPAHADLKAIAAEGAAVKAEALANPPEGAQPPPRPHDGTTEGMAKTADAQPVLQEAARQIVESRPDLQVPVGRDASGAVVTKDIGSALKSADTEIQKAQRDGALHEIAVACFLKG